MSADILLADLGVTKTHCRPDVSKDNPYSKAQFTTMKYRQDFPDRFGNIEDARSVCCQFFEWYCNEQRYRGIAMMTPANVRLGRAQEVHGQQSAVLEAAWRSRPDRFARAAQRLAIPKAA